MRVLTFGRSSLFAFSVLFVQSLLAQDTAPKRPWTLQTDFGFVNTSGNTSTTTLNAGETASYRTGHWTFAQGVGAVYGKTGGATSAENLIAGLRGDYAFTPRLAFYGLGGWVRNRFAGIGRRFEEGAGVSFKAVAGVNIGLKRIH